MVRVALKVLFDPSDLRFGVAGKSIAHEGAPFPLPARIVACLTGRHGVSDYQFAEAGNRNEVIWNDAAVLPCSRLSTEDATPAKILFDLLPLGPRHRLPRRDDLSQPASNVVLQSTEVLRAWH